MNLLGVHLTLLIGPDPVALPAPPPLVEALSEVEVLQADEGPSGFRLTFTVGRSGPLDLFDYRLVALPQTQTGARAIIVVAFNAIPRVLMDGIVIRRDLIPGEAPGEGRLVLSGRDLGAAMEREATPTEHPAMDESAIAFRIAARYPAYGLAPLVIPPPVLDPPLPVDRTPVQTSSDFAYLAALAERHGYVCALEPGPAPGANLLYFGPRIRPGAPQKALSVNLGPESNVVDLSFASDALAPERVQARVQDRTTGVTLPVLTPVSTRPPLGAMPDWARLGPGLRSRGMQTSGLSIAQAFARAQARFDRSVDETNRASGTLDALRYDGLLRAGAPVGLRGAGFTHDGTWIVREVRHRIGGGRYLQDFVLSRHDSGALSPVVRAA